jgi:hypothetical protein
MGWVNEKNVNEWGVKRCGPMEAFNYKLVVLST